MTSEKERDCAKSILTAFAQYSFRKTSMSDIASAAGISRQSVYKRFGSKEASYQWAINNYLSSMYSELFTLLEVTHMPSKQILMQVFDIFIGQGVEIIRHAHGAEVFRDILRVTHESIEDWPLRFQARLADFLVRHHVAQTAQANGLALSLISSGKGLLLVEASREQFLDDMKLIIDSVCINREL